MLRARGLEDDGGDVVVGLEGLLDQRRVVGGHDVGEGGHLGRDAAHVAARTHGEEVIPAVEVVREAETWVLPV